MKDNQNELEKMMENIDQPTIDVSAHQKEFRLTLLNTKKSATIGAVLLILPLLFLSGVVLKHYMGVDFGILTAVYEWIGETDREYGDSSFLNWMVRILLLFGPLVAIGINLLAILHVRYERSQKEVVLSIKLKWLNWSIIIICSMIFMVFLFYLIAENAAR